MHLNVSVGIISRLVWQEQSDANKDVKFLKVDVDKAEVRFPFSFVCLKTVNG